jgi:hypothetical protein
LNDICVGVASSAHTLASAAPDVFLNTIAGSEDTATKAAVVELDPDLLDEITPLMPSTVPLHANEPPVDRAPPEPVNTSCPADKLDTVTFGTVNTPVNVGEAIVAYSECEVVEPSAFKKFVAEPADDEITPEAELRSTPAVVSELSVGADENV